MKKFKLERTCALCNVLSLYLSLILLSPKSHSYSCFTIDQIKHMYFIFGNSCSHFVSPIKAVTNHAIAIICISCAPIEDFFVIFKGFFFQRNHENSNIFHFLRHSVGSKWFSIFHICESETFFSSFFFHKSDHVSGIRVGSFRARCFSHSRCSSRTIWRDSQETRSTGSFEKDKRTSSAIYQPSQE